MKNKGTLFGGVLLLGLGACNVELPVRPPEIDRTPAPPFTTLDQPLGLSVPLYVDKNQYILGYLQTTKVRIGDRLVIWDWKTESVQGTTFVDWSYRGLGAKGMAGSVEPHSYDFLGRTNSSDRALVFGSNNNTQGELVWFNAQTGALRATSVPGPESCYSPVSNTGLVLLVGFRHSTGGQSTYLKTYNLVNEEKSSVEWLVAEETDPAFSYLRPPVLDTAGRFWMVLDRDGPAGDQVFRFDPSAGTLDLVYTGAGAETSSMVLLGPGPGASMVAVKTNSETQTSNVLWFDDSGNPMPTSTPLNLPYPQWVAKGFQAQGQFYLVVATNSVAPYFVVAYDRTTGSLASSTIDVDLPSVKTVEVRGDQAFLFAAADFAKVEGRRLDLTKQKTVKWYSLPFAQIHNP